MSEEFVEFDNLGDLPKTLAKLGPVSPGDILVFRNFGDDMRDEIAGAVMRYYTALARPQILTTDTATEIPAAQVVPLLVFLPTDASLEHLDDADMYALGWERVAP